MQFYLDQASHNKDFHDCVVREFPDKFYDWKITATFYIALHLLKALAKKRGINIGQTHQEIEQSCNPERQSNKMSITKKAWKDYKALYRYSHAARYEGVTDIDTFEQLKQIDYKYCCTHIEEFRKYLKGQELPI